MRQLLTESVVLSLARRSLGCCSRQLRTTHSPCSALPHTLPRAENIGLHLPVLLYTVIASDRGRDRLRLNSGTSMRQPQRARALSNKPQKELQPAVNRLFSRLIVVQFALTLVLMTGAGMLLRSIRNLWHVSPGFDTRHVISFQVGLSPSFTSTPARMRTSYQQLLARISDVPGVEATDLTNIVPLSGADNGGPFWIGTKEPASLQEAPHALYFWTGPDYLKTMGIPLLQGRFFTAADQIESGKVVVIDSVLANSFFPGKNAVGQTLTVGHWGAARIVGVVGARAPLGFGRSWYL